jgi:hypothetical protein
VITVTRRDYPRCLSAGTGRDEEDVAVKNAHPIGILFTQQREIFVETNAAKLNARIETLSPSLT